MSPILPVFNKIAEIPLSLPENSMKYNNFCYNRFIGDII
jgi:hypothetical protein